MTLVAPAATEEQSKADAARQIDLVARGCVTHERMMFSAIYPKLERDVETAKDILSQAKVNALAAAAKGQFRGDCELSTWLYTIARNAANRHVKLAVRRKNAGVLYEHEMGELPEDTGPDGMAEVLTTATGGADEDSVERSIAARQDLESLHKALEEMKARAPAAHKAFCLYRLEQYTYDEMEQLFGMDKNQARCQVYRAKRFLEKRLDRKLAD